MTLGTTASASSDFSGGQQSQQEPSGGQPGFRNGGGGGGGGEGGGHLGGTRKDGGSAGGGGGNVGEAFDYRKAFDSTSGELRKVTQEFGRLREETSKDSDTLRQLREVFNPQEQADPVQAQVSQWESMLDYYIAQGVEAEKAGRPMPLTVNNGITLYRTLIAQAQEKQAMTSQLAEMKAQLQQLSDPQHHINQRAYESMDLSIKRGIDSLYGQGGDNMDQKRAIFQAVGSQLAPVIQQLQKTDPARWDMIRRDPEALAELANRALRHHVPPRALQMIAEEQMRNTPMSISELRQAMRELRANERIPAERKSEVETQLRQQILQQMYDSGKLGARGG